MADDVDVAGGTDDDHPDNNVANYAQMRINFCNMVNNTDFRNVLLSTNNYTIYLAGSIEGALSSTLGVDTVTDDNTVTIGVGFKDTTSTVCT